MVGTGMESLPLPGRSMDVCLEGEAYVIGRNLSECTRIQKGRYGEELTARFIQERGLTIIERNWRCCFGEVDIIAEDISDNAKIRTDMRDLYQRFGTLTCAAADEEADCHTSVSPPSVT